MIETKLIAKVLKINYKSISFINFIKGNYYVYLQDGSSIKISELELMKKLQTKLF